MLTATVEFIKKNNKTGLKKKTFLVKQIKYCTCV